MEVFMQPIECVIFDMDGTVVDVAYDWKRIKQELQTRGEPILSYIQNLEEPERSRKWTILEKYEAEATAQATLTEGMESFLAFLQEKNVKTALVTNNSRKNVDYLLNKFRLYFDLVLSREAGLWKPSGAPFLFVLEKFGIEKKQCCVVGDSHFDVKAAKDAGIGNIFILAHGKEMGLFFEAVIVQTVEELKQKIAKIL
jgi:HAD superfamily hydrolase (TIGR01549 family)